MTDKKQLNVRIPCELHRRINATDRPKQAVVVDALELYFDSVPKQDDSKSVALCAQQITEKDRQIAELHVMLQTSIGDLPKRLPAATREHWWQVWRKNQ